VNARTPLEYPKGLDVTWACLDWETTSEDAWRCEPVQVGLVIGSLRQGIVEAYHSRIDATVPSTPGALAVHGLTPEVLRGSPTWAQVTADIHARLVLHQVDALVCWNAAFDIAVLGRGLRTLGLGLPVQNVLCVRAWADDLIGLESEGGRRLRLADVAGLAGHQLEHAHDALEDAIATWHVLHWLRVRRNLLPGPCPRSVEDLAIWQDTAARRMTRRDCARHGVPYVEPFDAWSKMQDLVRELQRLDAGLRAASSAHV
jgi:DNA polymerase III epsilon subunit-like protein